MNRRQFLTGASAIAVSAALPVQPAIPDWTNGFTPPGPVRFRRVEDLFWQRYRELAELATRQIADSIYNNDYGHGGLAACFEPLDSPPHF